MSTVSDLAPVIDAAVRIGVLDEHTEGVLIEGRRRNIRDVELDAERLRTSLEHRQRLGVTAFRHNETRRRSPAAFQSARHRHRFGRCRRFVKQRCVRDLQTGEVSHHRLIVQDRLKAALSDLGLVRRVRGVPTRILQHVAKDDGWRVGVVVALPDQRPDDSILRRERPKFVQDGNLTERRRKVERCREPNRRWHGLIDQCIE